MMKSERQDEILREVKRARTATVPVLADLLGVSEITVRRDLDDLARAGLLERVRGGARLHSPRGPEPPVVQRQVSQVEEKQAIGQAAVDLVMDGDAIALESGSTVLEMARCLARRPWAHLQVVTNSFRILEELIHVPGIQLVFIGGLVSRDELGTFGVLAEDMLKNIRVNKLFLGCRGIDPHIGLMNDLGAEIEVATVRAMAASTEQVIALADHSKFGHSFFLRTLPISAVDVIVTDSQTPNSILEELRKQDIRIVLASARDNFSPEEPV
jgi:DeoR/GlpR family transcriptional regulator of sugar metabolism